MYVPPAVEAALTLEQLWNEIAESNAIHRLCAYLLAFFEGAEQDGICKKNVFPDVLGRRRTNGSQIVDAHKIDRHNRVQREDTTIN
jgi:hypothetical protein